MHWRAHSLRMQEHTDYADVVTDVIAELAEQLAAVAHAGITHSVVVDPGIGFSKTADQN